MFLLFSHKLTKEQIIEAENRFEIKDFIHLPKNLQKTWSAVPPYGPIHRNYLKNIKKFIQKNRGKENYIFIQGEPGLVCSMVHWAFDNDYIPVYATTERVYTREEHKDGSIINTHVFKHVNFRLYEYI